MTDEMARMRTEPAQPETLHTPAVTQANIATKTLC